MKLRSLAIASVSLVAFATPVFAQDSAPADDDGGAEDIVVTGSLIRGNIAPGGSQSIAVGMEKIEAVGAANTSDLISSIPQAGTFNQFVGVRGSSNFSLAVNRPSLRYLGNTSAAGATTLLLLDGHRMPGMGITQSSPDIDAIAAGAIERVDIITDGGSSTYGSDAIGGVMNFITRKSFDGIEAKASVGFGSNVKQYNAGVTVGKVWDTVNAYVTYDWSANDALYGRDLDWSQNLDWINNVGFDNACAVGSLRANNITYALPGLTAGLGNRCDNSEQTTFYPKSDKHSALASFGWDAGGAISFQVKAFYVNRKNTSDGGPLLVAGGSTVTSANRFAAPILASLPGSPTTGVLTYNLAPALGNSSLQRTNMLSWGITPTMKWDFGKGWQLNALFNYGIGKGDFVGQGLLVTPIAQAITAGTFNPFNLTDPGNAVALTLAQNQYTYGRGKHDLINTRFIVDGPLVTLPAGEIKAAVGIEYMREGFVGNNSRSAFLTNGAFADINGILPDRSAKRDIYSVFGEIIVPVMGEGSGPFHSLTVSASGRYDDYSDFGGTFNPKIGINLEPVEWLALRGNWGKAFQAPGIYDIAIAGAATANARILPFYNPTLPPPASRQVLLLMGGTIAPLSPQTAKTWSFGFDVKPPETGLAFGATYYNIDYKGVIGFPPITQPAVFYRDFANNNVLYTAGDAAMQAYFNTFNASNAATTIAGIAGGFASVYGVLDSRTQNLARIKTAGIDFYARYKLDTGFGDVFADVSGSRITAFKEQSNPAAPLVDNLPLNRSKLRVSTTVGANAGGFRGQLTWNFAQGFNIPAAASTLNQTTVGSYHLFNLFLQYKVAGDSKIAKDLAFTLNVDNLFDKDPPFYRGGDNSLFGVRNGFTLGRIIKLGVSKKF